MDLTEILAESFRMLVREPKMFVPKLLSTGISTIWILTFPGLYSGNLNSVSLDVIAYYLASMPFVVFLGVFVSVMLAEMVSETSELKKAFSKTVSNWKMLLLVTIGMVFSVFLAYLPTGGGIVLTAVSGSVIYSVAGFLLSLVLIVAFSFLVFFLPISLTEEGRLDEVFNRSVSSSIRNRKEVSIMLVFSVVLILIAFTLQGALKTLGLLGFAVSRMLSAIVTTYLFVVSPNMYLEDDG